MTLRFGIAFAAPGSEFEGRCGLGLALFAADLEVRRIPQPTIVSLLVGKSPFG